MSVSIGTKLVSRLGSPESRIPLATKDIFNSAGYTYFSYDSGGGIEAKDRLTDEVGTGLIWLGGIPLYRKIIDKTLFKKAGISPDVDIRVLKNKDYFKKAIENAPTDKIKSELKTAGENAAKTKRLNIIKFVLALGMTMASYAGLTYAKQHMTKKNIEKEFFASQKLVFEEDSPYKNLKPANNPNSVFAEFDTKNKHYAPSFKGISPMNAAADFVLNPIKNMIILDSGISAQRITSARTKGERKEYAIKEGSFLFFVYGADKLIKKGINAASKKFLNTPVDLDADFISSGLAENILKNKEAQKSVDEFVTQFAKSEDTKKLYEFIFDNPDNFVVKAAQKSGIISTIKDASGEIKTDPRKYIEPEKMKELGKNLRDFIKTGNAAENKVKYLNKVRGLKVASTILNVALCCLALGYAVPKFIYDSRKKNQNGESGFHVKNEYVKELKEKQKTL